MIVDNLERLAEVGYTEGMPPQTPRSSTDGGGATDFASGSLDIEVRADTKAMLSRLPVSEVAERLLVSWESGNTGSVPACRRWNL